MREPLRGIDEWITRDDRVELPAEIYWVDGFEFTGSFEIYEEALRFVLQFGDSEMKEYPSDYIYSEQPEY